MGGANRYLEQTYRASHNREFGVAATLQGTAYVPFLSGSLPDILCEQHERTVGNDNCVSFEGLCLQLPSARAAPPLRAQPCSRAPLRGRYGGGVSRASQTRGLRRRRHSEHWQGGAARGRLSRAFNAARWLHLRFGLRPSLRCTHRAINQRPVDNLLATKPDRSICCRQCHHRHAHRPPRWPAHQNAHCCVRTTHTPSTPLVTACAITGTHSLPVRT